MKYCTVLIKLLMQHHAYITTCLAQNTKFFLEGFISPLRGIAVGKTFEEYVLTRNLLLLSHVTHTVA